MPRALYWFRWGAAFTWVTGVLLLLLVYYHGGSCSIADRQLGPRRRSSLIVARLRRALHLRPARQDGAEGSARSASAPASSSRPSCSSILACVGGFGFRGYSIHLGAMFGTIMAFNVWFRIWPAQQQIITATKNGHAAGRRRWSALAGLRSKHNTYMSVPLIFT